MFGDFFTPANAPFAIALLLMAFMGIAEILGLLFGMAPSSMLDSMLPDIPDFGAELSGGSLDGDAPTVPDAPGGGLLSSLLGWLCVGRVPVLVLLVAFLCAFGLSGFIIQGTLYGLFGWRLHAVLAVVPAFVVGLAGTRYLGLGLAHILPKEESEAVSHQSFVGKIATIIRGTAKSGLPAEAKLSDANGQTHYLLVEPDNAGEAFAQGTEVLIVRKVGSIFRAIANTSAALSERSKES